MNQPPSTTPPPTPSFPSAPAWGKDEQVSERSAPGQVPPPSAPALAKNETRLHAPSCEEPLDLLDLPLRAMEEFFQGLGEAPFRARQIFRWLYRQRETNIEKMTDLSGALRSRLAQIAWVGRLERVECRQAQDGTQKFLWRLADGATIESVLIPEGGRLTLCLSSQTGCALGCTFCHTARLGPGRNLRPGEYLAQLLGTLDYLGPSASISNLVFMGMGEPLANLPHLLDALSILLADHGLNYSPRRIVVSTAGLCPQIITLGQHVPVRLAVSLNATTDEVRNQLMPLNRRYNLQTLRQTLRAFPLPPRNRITLEYVLIRDLNDSEEDARRLIRFSRSFPSKVNLLTYNEHPGATYQAPSPERVERFKDLLLAGKVRVLQRLSRGEDILAACGQLAARSP